MIKPGLFANVLKLVRKHKHRHERIQRLYDFLVVRVRKGPIQGLYELTQAECNQILSAKNSGELPLGFTMVGEPPPFEENINLRAWPPRTILTRDGLPIALIEVAFPQSDIGIDYTNGS